MYQIFYKYCLLLVLLFVYSQTVVCQVAGNRSRSIDSLQKAISDHNGIDKFNPTYDLVFEFLYAEDYQAALNYINDASELAITFGDSLKIVKTGRVKAQILRRLERSHDAIEAFIGVRDIAKRNSYQDEYNLILNGLAIVYTFQAEYDKALNCHFESLHIRQLAGNKKDISTTFNNIGIVYFKLRNYEKALYYYEQALTIENEVKESPVKDRLLINMGLCYNQLRDFGKGREYIMRGLAVCSAGCNRETLIEGEFGLGVSHLNQSAYEEASVHFKKSLRIATETGNKRFMAENYECLGQIYLHTGKYDSAQFSLSNAEQLATDAGFDEVLIQTYRDFSNLFEKNKEYEKVAMYQNRYINLKDSIYSETLIDNLAKIQTDYAERQNIKTIADKEEIIERQRYLNLAIAVIAVLAALLIFVLYRSNRVKRKVNAALSEAKNIIEDQNRQLLNSNFYLGKELKERNIDLEKANESLRRVNDELDNFIYKTSHDIRGPLASLKGMCNVALIDVKDPVALDYLHKLDVTADKMNTILTRLLIVNQLNHSALGTERIQFEEIVNDLLLLERKKGLPDNFVITTNISSDIEFYSDREFVRIILENLIDNAIKFYNDSKRITPFVSIIVTADGQQVNIKVIDNGIGIAQHPDKIFQMFTRASERSQTGGIGLYITKTAVEKLGGEILLSRSPEGYTEFLVKLPLESVKVTL